MNTKHTNNFFFFFFTIKLPRDVLDQLCISVDVILYIYFGIHLKNWLDGDWVAQSQRWWILTGEKSKL